MKKQPDTIDKRILSELQNNGRLPIVELANRVHLTKTPTA
ncbi:MAG: AsnC family protein, partial [Pseudomonadota bacterium]